MVQADVDEVQRPAAGIWGGLWSPPEFATREELQASPLATVAPLRDATPVPHVFTHFDLLIHPVWVAMPGTAVADEPGVLWYNAARPAQVGLPAPIVQLLQEPP